MCHQTNGGVWYKVLSLNRYFFEDMKCFFARWTTKRCQIIADSRETIDTFEAQNNFDDSQYWLPSGNKPWPEPILTHIYVAIWRH